MEQSSSSSLGAAEQAEQIAQAGKRQTRDQAAVVALVGVAVLRLGSSEEYAVSAYAEPSSEPARWIMPGNGSSDS